MASETFFKPIYTILTISGTFNVYELHGWKPYAYKVYRFFTFMICLYGLEVMIKGAFTSEFVAFYLGLGVITVWAVLDSAYFLVREEKIKELLLKIEKLNDIFENDPLSGKGFVSTAMKFNTKVQFYIKIYIISQTALPCLNGLLRFLRYQEIFDLEVKLFQHDLSQLPFLNGVDVIILIYTVSKQAGTDCFFVCIFLHLTLYFNHLRNSVTKIFTHGRTEERAILPALEESPNGGMLKMLIKSWRNKNLDNYEENIKVWVKMHQEVLKVSQELIVLYKPVLIIQFAIMYFLFVLIMFILTQGFQDKVLIVIGGLYWVMLLAVFFALCLVGNELTHCSGRLWDYTMACPWYQGSRAARRCMLIVGERVRKPLIINVYCSHMFQLSSSTFLWVMKSVVTVYLALININNRRLTV